MLSLYLAALSARAHASSQLHRLLTHPSVRAKGEQARRALRASVKFGAHGARTAAHALGAGLKAATQAAIRAAARAGNPPLKTSAGRPPRGAKERRRGSAPAASAGGVAGGGGELLARQQAAMRRIASLPEDDHYGVLGLDEGCSTGAVKSAFRQAARLLHPDKCREADAHAVFLRLQAAHEVLTDEMKRIEYDRARARYGSLYRSQANKGWGKRSSSSWQQSRQYW
jgi:hypothetical protein